MLETLVPSKVRRALFEQLLTHPTERVYLRGLAKSLSVSVTPLRRELKRLEESGVLRAVEEGHIRFYELVPDAPMFQQLQRAVSMSTSLAPQPPVIQTEPAGVPAKAPSSVAATQALGSASTAEGLALLRRPLLIGAMLLALGLALVAAGLWQVWRVEQRLVTAPAIVLPGARPAGVTAPPAGSLMHGARWRLLPGGFGGFSSSAPGPEDL